jgi:tetratricopeptide (TPR) repeat protein
MGYHLEQARTYRLALGPADDHSRTLGLRAGRRLAAAGRRAADRDDVQPALRLLSQAEALLVEDPPARFAALLALANVAFQENYTVALEAASRAESVSADVGELATRRARLWTSSIRAMTDPTFTLSDARAEVEAGRQAFEAAGDVDALLDAHQVMLLVDLNVAHWQDVATSARRGVELATATGRALRRADFAGWLSNALLWGSTPASESLATIESLLVSETRRLTRSSMLSAISLLRAVLGDRAGADAAHIAGMAIRDDLGSRRSEFRHAYMEYALDDFPAAFEVARSEAADLERRGDTGQRSTMVGLQAWLLTLMGRDDEAARLAEEARQLAAPDDAVSQILWRAAAGVAKARLGLGEEADQITSDAITIAEGTDSMDAGTEWEARARVLSILGRRSEASSAARRALELYTQKGSVNFARRVEKLIADLR